MYRQIKVAVRYYLTTEITEQKMEESIDTVPNNHDEYNTGCSNCSSYSLLLLLCRKEHQQHSANCPYNNIKDPYKMTVGDVLELEKCAAKMFIVSYLHIVYSRN